MKFEEFTSGTRWEVLRLIAERERSASEVARALSASIANVSQQARLLEAHGILEREKKKDAEHRGKPHERYRIAKPLLSIAEVRPGSARKRTFTPTVFQHIMANILFWPRADEQEVLLKFLVLHEQLVQQSRAIAVSEAKGDELHLLIVTHPEALEQVRELSKAVIEAGVRRTVICWAHTEEEIRTGLQQHEEYYRNHLRKPFVLVDTEGILHQLSVLRAEK